MAQSRSKNLSFSRRNPIAKALKFFTQKIIRDKTKYNRKIDGQVCKKYLWRGF